jgi:antitoxin CcdA
LPYGFDRLRKSAMRIRLAHEDYIREAPMMSDRPAKKRAVNLFVDADLLDQARRMRINISDTLERRLRMIVRAEQEKRWLEENKDAIASINAFIDRNGLLASKLRYRSDRR